ncbi:hypothetical protein NDU88_000226, partial [Pleurodeles waltl]
MGHFDLLDGKINFLIQIVKKCKFIVFVKKVTKSHSEWALGKNFNFFHQKSEKIQISSFLVPKVKKSNFNFFLQK